MLLQDPSYIWATCLPGSGADSKARKRRRQSEPPVGLPSPAGQDTPGAVPVPATAPPPKRSRLGRLAAAAAKPSGEQAADPAPPEDSVQPTPEAPPSPVAAEGADAGAAEGEATATPGPQVPETQQDDVGASGGQKKKKRRRGPGKQDAAEQTPGASDASVGEPTPSSPPARSDVIKEPGPAHAGGDAGGTAAGPTTSPLASPPRRSAKRQLDLSDVKAPPPARATPAPTPTKAPEPVQATPDGHLHVYEDRLGGATPQAKQGRGRRARCSDPGAQPAPGSPKTAPPAGKKGRSKKSAAAAADAEADAPATQGRPESQAAAATAQETPQSRAAAAAQARAAAAALARQQAETAERPRQPAASPAVSPRAAAVPSLPSPAVSPRAAAGWTPRSHGAEDSISEVGLWEGRVAGRGQVGGFASRAWGRSCRR